MRVVLAVFILVSSLSASALQTQTLVIGSGTFNQTAACGQEDENVAKQAAIASAEAQCEEGDIQQVTDFGKVLKKPVASFCYLTVVTAVFECLQNPKGK